MVQKNITSEDVAKLAKVSQSAVSRTFTPGAIIYGISGAAVNCGVVFVESFARFQWTDCRGLGAYDDLVDQRGIVPLHAVVSHDR